MEKTIMEKSLSKWVAEFPMLSQMMQMKEVFWVNPALNANAPNGELSIEDIERANDRLNRFAPYFIKAFPETQATNGILESPLREIPKMKAVLEKDSGKRLPGKIYLKMDSHLPVSGSIKARGGIYEVLNFAEEIAIKEGLLKDGMSYDAFAEETFKNVFSKYSVAVGSTGNLGLSIGIISAKLGFRVTVHMSQDAQQWKKNLLREKGVVVVEHKDDYSCAVAAGREDAARDPYCHFVDDENSRTLFLGYAVAALRFEKQLQEAGIRVDANHPIFFYLPCGVGGGPGGICFGMKKVFQNSAHCFFAEPTHSPSMLLGLYTNLHDAISVQDFGIDNHTAADGLAVGRASSFVGRTIQPYLSGSYTVEDQHMYKLLYQLAESEGIHLEPSALAGMSGPFHVVYSNVGQSYLKEHELTSVMENSTHIVWATGGSMVPFEVKQKYLSVGRNAL